MMTVRSEVARLLRLLAKRVDPSSPRTVRVLLDGKPLEFVAAIRRSEEPT